MTGGATSMVNCPDSMTDTSPSHERTESLIRHSWELVARAGTSHWMPSVNGMPEASWVQVMPPSVVSSSERGASESPHGSSTVHDSITAPGVRSSPSAGVWNTPAFGAGGSMAKVASEVSTAIIPSMSMTVTLMSAPEVSVLGTVHL